MLSKVYTNSKGGCQHFNSYEICKTTHRNHKQRLRQKDVKRKLKTTAIVDEVEHLKIRFMERSSNIFV